MGFSCFKPSQNKKRARHEEHNRAAVKVTKPATAQRRSTVPIFTAPYPTANSPTSLQPSASGVPRSASVPTPVNPEFYIIPENETEAQKQKRLAYEKARLVERKKTLSKEQLQELAREKLERMSRKRPERVESYAEVPTKKHGETSALPETQKKWTWGMDMQISAADLLNLRGVDGKDLIEQEKVKLRERRRRTAEGFGRVDEDEDAFDGGYYMPHSQP